MKGLFYCWNLSILHWNLQSDQLEQLRETVTKVRDLFHDTDTTEFIIVTIPTVVLHFCFSIRQNFHFFYQKIKGARIFIIVVKSNSSKQTIHWVFHALSLNCASFFTSQHNIYVCFLFKSFVFIYIYLLFPLQSHCDRLIITCSRLWQLVNPQDCMLLWRRKEFLFTGLLLIKSCLLPQTASSVPWEGR